MAEAYIIDAVRTPVGKRGGGLAGAHPADMAAHVISTVVGRHDIDPAAIEFLEKYTWPGNVSELRNAIERACAFAENDRVKPSDLPAKVTQQIEVPTPSSSEGITKLPIGSTLDDFIKDAQRIAPTSERSTNATRGRPRSAWADSPSSVAAAALT